MVISICVHVRKIIMQDDGWCFEIRTSGAVKLNHCFILEGNKIGDLK